MPSFKSFATGLAGLATLVSASPKISGYTLQWSDEFSGASGSLPSSTNWIIDTGTSYPGGPAQWGTGEIETYTSSTSNIQQNGNGYLTITPRKDSSGNWTSARIESVKTFTPPAKGRMIVQASIALPNLSASQSQGLWPAFWMLGAAYRGNYQNWPSIGEFDIMENVNGGSQIQGTLHCGTNPGGPCDETNGIASTLSCSGSACQGNFHTYSILVDNLAQKLTWSLDGTAYQTITPATLGNTTWQAAVENSKFILLNFAIGGGWPGNPNSATVAGKPMKVDYVAVYYG